MTYYFDLQNYDKLFLFSYSLKIRGKFLVLRGRRQSSSRALSGTVRRQA
jgi:hypothetical protein